MTIAKKSITRSKKVDYRSLRRRATRKAGIQYVKLGYSVVVLHGVVNGVCTCSKGSTCGNPGKHPATPHGVKDATKSVQTLNRLLDKYPDANLGLATGREAGLIVLDVDPRHGGNETIESLLPSLGRFPLGPKSQTGDGWHRFFEPPGKPIQRDTAGKVFGAGVDVIGENSYVVVPPSIHFSGKSYKFAVGRSLLKGIKPPRLPDHWRKKLLTTSDKNAVAVRGNGSLKPTSPPPSGLATKSTGADGQLKIPEGERNSTLTRIGGYLVTTALTDQAVLHCLLLVNQSRCEPPLDETEVKGIADSVAKYRPAHVQTTHDAPEYVALGMALAENFEGGRHLRFIPKHGFHLYDGKRWIIEEEENIQQIVLRTIEKLPPGGRKILSLLSDVMRLAAIKQAARAELFYSDTRQCVLNLVNGELWIADNGDITFKEHTPDSNLLNCLQVEYDPEAKCPEYDRAVLQIFGESKEAKDMARHWNEVAGYMIQTVRDIPLILMLLGEGSNGKTALWMTLRKLIGDENILSGSLGQIDSDRFMIGFLRGKTLFIDDDIKAGQKLPDGALKKISEDKLLTGQLKGRDAFQFTNRALPVMLANNEPTTADLTEGMKRRIMVIPFKHEFKVGADLDRDLWKRLRNTEMSGILNRLIQGLQRLRKRGDFKVPLDVRHAKRDWYRNANPLVGFLHERVQRAAKERILLADLYRAYETWADESGIGFHIQRNNLSRQLLQLKYNVRRTNRGRAVIGVTLKG